MSWTCTQFLNSSFFWWSLFVRARRKSSLLLSIDVAFRKSDVVFYDVISSYVELDQLQFLCHVTWNSSQSAKLQRKFLLQTLYFWLQTGMMPDMVNGLDSSTYCLWTFGHSLFGRLSLSHGSPPWCLWLFLRLRKGA